MKKYDYNENYFENIDSEDKAYFLGFICADGYISSYDKSKRYLVCLKLHIKDNHILETFIQCVNGTMPVWRHKQREMSEVKLTGKKIITDLKNLDITYNKTHNLKYPKIDEKLERHFLRGYFDGDGCIRISKDKRDGTERGDLKIVGSSIDMMKSINNRFNFLFGTNMNKLYGPKEKCYKFIGWAGMSDIEKIYHGFYDDSSYFLIRKKKIFDNVIKVIENKQKYRKK